MNVQDHVFNLGIQSLQAMELQNRLGVASGTAASESVSILDQTQHRILENV